MSDTLDNLNAAAAGADNGASIGQVVVACQWRLSVRVKSAMDWWPSGPVTVRVSFRQQGTKSEVTRMLSTSSSEIIFTGTGADRFEATAEAQSWTAVETGSGSVKDGQKQSIELTITSPKTWVGIQLLDMANQPVANRPYRLKLPTGQFKEGKLDRNGTVRVHDIEPGQCLVCFPDLDEDAWHRL